MALIPSKRSGQRRLPGFRGRCVVGVFLRSAALLVAVGVAFSSPVYGQGGQSDCAEVSVLEIACVADEPGIYSLSLNITNLGFVPTIEHFFVTSPSLPVSPDAFEITPLSVGDSVTISMTVTGAIADVLLCFDLSLHDGELVECCSVQVCVDVPSCGTTFVRGDCNADGGFDISDAITMLSILFSGAPPPLCDDACDANDDGAFNIGDAVYLLSNLFSGGPPPPIPFPDCGSDPTPDSIDCVSFPPCP